MAEINDIRRRRRDGDSISEIPRDTGLAWNTVKKYAKMEDLSPERPEPAKRGSVLDAYRPWIEEMLDEDRRNWRKQKHTARRICQRLRDEHGCPARESTVRHYVARLKKERAEATDGYLTLEWAPGEAQADFGEADFRVYGVTERLPYFVLTFPYSNVGLA